MVLIWFALVWFSIVNKSKKKKFKSNFMRHQQILTELSVFDTFPIIDLSNRVLKC